MEEVAHVFLGHKPNRLAFITNDHGQPQAPESTPPTKGRMAARDYNKSDEEAAYAVGAAALVPYATMRRLVLEGQTADQIARRFRVSRQLVEYRIKVTHLWSIYKRASASRGEHV